MPPHLVATVTSVTSTSTLSTASVVRRAAHQQLVWRVTPTDNGDFCGGQVEPRRIREAKLCTPLSEIFPLPHSSANTMFEIEWHGRRVALKASNGRYVCMKKNGQLAAISDFVGEHSLLL